MFEIKGGGISCTATEKHLRKNRRILESFIPFSFRQQLQLLNTCHLKILHEDDMVTGIQNRLPQAIVRPRPWGLQKSWEKTPIKGTPPRALPDPHPVLPHTAGPFFRGTPKASCTASGPRASPGRSCHVPVRPAPASPSDP